MPDTSHTRRPWRGWLRASSAAILAAVTLTTSVSAYAVAEQPVSIDLSGNATDIDYLTDAAVEDERAVEALIVDGRAELVAPDADDRKWFETLAGELGEPYEELLANEPARDRFSDVAAEIAEATPETFVESGVVRPDSDLHDFQSAGSLEQADYGAWITFTQQPGAEILQRLAEAQPLRVQVRYNAPASAAELDELLAVAFTEFTDPLPLAAAEGSVAEGEIVVRFKLDGTPRVDLEALAEDAVALTAEASEEETLPLPIRFVHDPETPEAQADAAAAAGDKLTVGATSNYCTAGFAAKRDGLHGILTAAHCPNNLRWRGVAGVIEYRKTADMMSADGLTGHVDMEFQKMLGGNTSSPIIRTPPDVINVVAAKNPSFGGSISKFGQTTKVTHGTVTGTGPFCHKTSAGVYCGQWKANYKRGGGDSGGPVYTNRTARGIHSGYTDYGATSLFVPISRASASLDATVKTV